MYKVFFVSVRVRVVWKGRKIIGIMCRFSAG